MVFQQVFKAAFTAIVYRNLVHLNLRGGIVAAAPFLYGGGDAGDAGAVQAQDVGVVLSGGGGYLLRGGVGIVRSIHVDGDGGR